MAGSPKPAGLDAAPGLRPNHVKSLPPPKSCLPSGDSGVTAHQLADTPPSAATLASDALMRICGHGECHVHNNSRGASSAPLTFVYGIDAT